MEYSIITVIAVTLTTLLVYQLANNVLHLNLRWKPLLLCAGCALFMSLVIPRFVVTMAGLAGTLGVLAVFAILFAYFIAYFDEPEAQATASAPSFAADVPIVKDASFPAMQLSREEAPPSTGATTNYDAALDTVIEETFVSSPQVTAVSLAREEEVPSDLSRAEAWEAEMEEEGPEIEDLGEQILLADWTMPPADQSILPTDATDAEASSLPEDVEDVSIAAAAAEQTDGGLAVPGSETAGELAAVTAVEKETPAIEVTVQPSTDLDNVPVAVPSIKADQAAVQGAFAAAAATNADSGAESETMEEEEKDSAMADLNILPEDFDDLLDMAFNLLETGFPAKAVAVFRHALALYPDSEAAPFIATQIGSILKNSGAYDDAIQILTEARSLPAFKHDATLEEEFINSVALLRITKNILLDHRMGYLPYERIPDEVRKEIDTEFHEWRNLA